MSQRDGCSREIMVLPESFGGVFPRTFFPLRGVRREEAGMPLYFPSFDFRCAVPRDQRPALATMIRHLRREGTQLAWALDYSVHAIATSRYLVYFPDPLSALEVAPLPAVFGEDHHQAALAFLSRRGPQSRELALAGAATC